MGFQPWMVDNRAEFVSEASLKHLLERMVLSASPLARCNWGKAQCWHLSALYCEEVAALQLTAVNPFCFWPDSFILARLHLWDPPCGQGRRRLITDLAKIPVWQPPVWTREQTN